MAKAIFDQNDNLIRVEGLKDASEGGSFLNAALVSAKILDPSGALVPGTSITLNFVAASNGNYEGTVESTVSYTVGPDHEIIVDAVEAGIVGHWQLPIEVKTRRA